MSTSPVPQSTRPSLEEDEITIFDLIKFFKRWLIAMSRQRNTILTVILIFFVIGLISAFSRTLLYTTTHKVMSYNISEQTPQMAQLQRLGGLFGQLPTNQRSLLTGDLIITLLDTYPVGHAIANQKLRFYEHGSLTFLEYFNDYYPVPLTDRIRPYTIGLPGKVFGFINRTPNIQIPDSLLIIPGVQTSGERFISPSSTKILFNPSKKDIAAFKKLRSAITIEVTGSIITIEATLPDPLASYDLALVATDILMQEAVNVEVKKTKEQLQFIQEQYDMSLSRFQDAQIALAAFQDQNKSIVSERARIQLQQLQNEYNLAFQLYSASSNQLEEAKIRLREDTPLFSVLDPAKLPLRPENASRTLVLIQYILIGLMVSMFIATLRDYKGRISLFYRGI